MDATMAAAAGGRGAQPWMPEVPLAAEAQRMLDALARRSRSRAIAGLQAANLLLERAGDHGWTVPSVRSAGGGCRLFACADDAVALNLARPDDMALLPALFGEWAAPASDAAVARLCARHRAADLVSRGRDMGLAIAAVSGPPPAAPAAEVQDMRRADGPPPDRALVVDLSALWAGPLAGHLLWLAGHRVVKVESRSRPDRTRQTDPALFARLNQGKRSIAVDLACTEDRAALLALLERADVVIESSRPRALLQHGIDGRALVRARPGLLWLAITGHGTWGDAANWIGFGDDCAVAAGLAARLRAVAGRAGFVGDALADPLTGIAVARIAAQALAVRRGGHITVSMAALVAGMLRRAEHADWAGLDAALRRWARAAGQPIPPARPRALAAVADFGADSALLRGGAWC